MNPLQTVIADQHGLSISGIMQAIETHYVSPKGTRVRASIARGVYLDGAPEGFIILKDREDG